MNERQFYIKPSFTEVQTNQRKQAKLAGLSPSEKRVELFFGETSRPSSLKLVPDTVDVLDGVTDLPSHLFIVTLHLRGNAEEGGRPEESGRVENG